MRRSIVNLLALALILAMPFAAEPVLATEAAWARIAEGGYTILLRHAPAQRTGGPPGSSVEDCAGRRNLTDRGLQSARRIGAQFAARAAGISSVYTSRACPAIETAIQAFGEERVEPLAALDRLTDDLATHEEQTAVIREMVRSFAGIGNQVMVTHEENIAALTGAVPRQGEAIIVAPSAEGEAELRIVGRLLLD